MIDLTQSTSKAVQETDVKDGIVTIFVEGSTAALTTIEYEPGLIFPKCCPELYQKI